MDASLVRVADGLQELFCPAGDNAAGQLGVSSKKPAPSGVPVDVCDYIGSGCSQTANVSDALAGDASSFGIAGTRRCSFFSRFI